MISVKGSPSRCIPVKQVPKGGIYLHGKGKADSSGGGPSMSRMPTALDPETGQGAESAVFWMYAAQGAEVEVDQETGKVKVLRMVSVHDVGKAVNPAACEQQIEGPGTGIGATLHGKRSG